MCTINHEHFDNSEYSFLCIRRKSINVKTDLILFIKTHISSVFDKQHMIIETYKLFMKITNGVKYNKIIIITTFGHIHNIQCDGYSLIKCLYNCIYTFNKTYTIEETINDALKKTNDKSLLLICFSKGIKNITIPKNILLIDYCNDCYEMTCTDKIKNMDNIEDVHINISLGEPYNDFIGIMNRSDISIPYTSKKLKYPSIFNEEHLSILNAFECYVTLCKYHTKCSKCENKSYEINEQMMDIYTKFFEHYIKYYMNQPNEKKENFHNTILNNIRHKMYIIDSKLKTKKQYNSFYKNINLDHIPNKNRSKLLKKFKNEKDTKLIENKNIDLSDISSIETEDYFSDLSLTDWKDEVRENSCLGLLINVYIPNYCRMGNLTHMIEIRNLSNTYMSVNDYMMLFCEPTEKINCDVNSSVVIDDRILGSGNTILPIYINKIHWSMCKKYISPVLGLLFANNPSYYREGMDNIYYMSLLDFIDKKLLIDLNYKSVKVWLSLLRTCMELSFEKKYHKEFKKEKPYDLCTKNGNVWTLGVIYGQMISINYNDKNKIKKMANDHIMSIINLFVLNTSRSRRNELKEIIKKNNEETKKEITNIFEICEIYLLNLHYLIMCNIGNIFDEMRSHYGSIKDFLKKTDEQMGIYDEKFIDKIYESFIDMHKNITSTDYMLISIEYVIENIKIK
jgi:hypothetical protein